ncbi:MAG: helix-turn-helix transcriptional regulator [Thermodesulfobacteriota bacterium]|nr:helix-turn-helix transcriptional regulator [Thermodesulfobacteriota bacterium]
MIKTHKEIGAEIKRIRKALGMSQMKLAEEIGVSFQQIQKYEKGINKISAEMIQRLAMALGVSVNTFFEKEKTLIVSEPPGKYYSKRKSLTGETSLPLNLEETALLQLFRKIESKKIREGLIQQLSGIAELEKRKE